MPLSLQFGGLRQSLGFFSNNLSQGLIESLGGLFFLVLFRILVRKQWIAMVLLTVLIAFILGGSEGGWVLAVRLVVAGIRVFAMVRFGLLAAAVITTVFFLLTSFPVAIHASDWYLAVPLLLWSFVAALALYGFRTAVGKAAFSAVLEK
jgi:energy-converting hydrogenase Eha subunit B